MKAAGKIRGWAFVTKWLAILFGLFVIALIVLADTGVAADQLKAMHALPYGDKIGHFVLIGILSFLVISSLIQSLPARDSKLVAVITGLILLFIFTVEEALQGPIPGRDASFKDLAANYAGILFFGCTAWAINRRRKA